MDKVPGGRAEETRLLDQQYGDVERAFAGRAVFLAPSPTVRFLRHPGWSSWPRPDGTPDFVYLESEFAVNSSDDRGNVTIWTWLDTSSRTPILFPGNDSLFQHLQTFVANEYDDETDAIAALERVEDVAAADPRRPLPELVTRDGRGYRTEVGGLTITVAHRPGVDEDFRFETRSPQFLVRGSTSE